eukprot:10684773-Heterocapsa_arctica.AAC.1
MSTEHRKQVPRGNNPPLSGSEWLDAGSASARPSDGNSDGPNKMASWFTQSGEDERADRRCPHFVAGKCKKGHKCHMRHDKQELAEDVAQLHAD